VALVDAPDAQVAIATTAGHLLVFPAAELPELTRGKGNKLIGIPSARVKAREEVVAAIQVLPANASLSLHCGKRHLTLKPADLEHYRAERGRRGGLLPKGLQRVDEMQVV
jgi:topoisomerase-4 subunit A